MIINYVKVVILGIIEGITEWVPVSSTGHLIIMNKYLRLDVTEEFWQLFEVTIQLGAIIAAIVIFWDKIVPKGWRTVKCSKKLEIFNIHSNYEQYILWSKIIVAMIPSVVIGLLLGDYIEENFYNYKVVSIALIIWGIAFIRLECRENKRKVSTYELGQISYLQALGVGLFQIIAVVFPGTSRSGATILKLYSFGIVFEINELMYLLTGSIVAFIVSIFIIKALTNYIKKKNFVIFGWYRLMLGVIVIGYFFVVD